MSAIASIPSNDAMLLRVIDQHCDAAWINPEKIVGHRQVRTPIAIEVTHRNGTRKDSSTEVHRRLKRPIPIAQKHRDVVGTLIRHGQVLNPIAIEVSYSHETRRESGTIVYPLLEGPVP